MSDEEEDIILSELSDDELVLQMHDDLYDGLKEEIVVHLFGEFFIRQCREIDILAVVNSFVDIRHVCASVNSARKFWRAG